MTIGVVWAGPRNPELNEALGQFVAVRIGVSRGFGPYASMGVVQGSSLIAAVVFHNWHPEAGVMEMSSASDSKLWLTKPVLNAMFSFIFDESDCQLCVLRVSERNHVMNRIAARFGFDAHAIPRLRGQNEAEIIHTLTREQWDCSPFKEIADGQGRAEST